MGGEKIMKMTIEKMKNNINVSWKSVDSVVLDERKMYCSAAVCEIWLKDFLFVL